MKQDNDPKHTASSTNNIEITIETNRTKIFRWMPDFNPDQHKLAAV